MKKLTVPYVEKLNVASIQSASELLEESGRLDVVECVNWSELYPYRPITYFFVGRSKDAFFVKYSVKGTMLKAVYTEDYSPVYEDSCVEFFCMLEQADTYMNFEFNSIGTCDAARRKGRSKDVKRISVEEIKTIERFPSIGTKAFKEMEGMFEWELTVKIPFKLMGLDGNRLPEKILANFYKCADDTDSMHYVTWAPIKTEKPDFHRPEFFGELYFD
ncbi:MAG: carbohydrate-binding family 9-like protein [Paludibacteraceae bacterium]